MISPKRLVIFDVDGTLITGQSQRVFLNILRKERLISWGNYMLLLLWFFAYKLNLVKNTKHVREKAYQNLKDVPVKKIDKAIQDNFSVFMSRLRPNIVDILQRHVDNGDKIIIVSASTEPIIKRVCDYFNLHDYFCTRLDQHNGQFTGTINGEAVYGNYKAKLVADLLKIPDRHYTEVFFYTDHISDLKILEMVDVPVCVCPDKQLREIAEKNNWKIIDCNNRRFDSHGITYGSIFLLILAALVSWGGVALFLRLPIFVLVVITFCGLLLAGHGIPRFYIIQTSGFSLQGLGFCAGILCFLWGVFALGLHFASMVTG